MNSATRRAVWVAIVAAPAIVLPVSASATTAEISGTSLLVTADPGEHNDLYATHVFAGESQYQVSEEGTDATLTVGNGCAPTGFPDQAYCPTAGITTVEIDTLDRADSAFVQATGLNPSVTVLAGSGDDEVQGGESTGETIEGGSGRDVLLGGGIMDTDPLDTLVGGTGRDKLFGEGGPDKLKAKDGERDKVIDCGDGDDPKAKRDRGLDPKPTSC